MRTGQCQILPHDVLLKAHFFVENLEMWEKSEIIFFFRFSLKLKNYIDSVCLNLTIRMKFSVSKLSRPCFQLCEIINKAEHEVMLGDRNKAYTLSFLTHTNYVHSLPKKNYMIYSVNILWYHRNHLLSRNFTENFDKIRVLNEFRKQILEWTESIHELLNLYFQIWLILIWKGDRDYLFLLFQTVRRMRPFFNILKAQ